MKDLRMRYPARMRRSEMEQLVFGRRGNMAAGYAWFLVLGSVFLCNLMKALLPSISSFVSVTYLQYMKCLSLMLVLLLQNWSFF